jgi:hypothetical protein
MQVAIQNRNVMASSQWTTSAPLTTLMNIFGSRRYLIGAFQDRRHEQDFAEHSHFLGKRLDL